MKPDFETRPATDEDRAFLEDLHAETLAEYGRTIFGWGREEMDRHFRQDFQLGNWEIVVVDGETAGGVAVVQQEGRLFLDLIALRPSYQGRGIGTALLRRVLTRAGSLGVGVRLNVLRINRARELYRRLGFEIVGGDEHRLFMEWSGP